MDSQASFAAAQSLQRFLDGTFSLLHCQVAEEPETASVRMARNGATRILLG
jgi:hypothetical protein